MDNRIVTTLLACLVAAKAAFAQSLVDDSKHRSNGAGDKDLLDIQWMLVGHRTTSPTSNMLAISYDGKTMVSGGDIDSTLKIWDVERHVLKRTIVVRGLSEMRYVDVDPQGTKVLCGSKMRLYIFDAKTGVQVNRFASPCIAKQAKLTVAGTVAILEDRLGEGGNTYLVDPATGRVLGLLDNKSEVNNVPINPERRTLFMHATSKTPEYDPFMQLDTKRLRHQIRWMPVVPGIVEYYSWSTETNTDDAIVVCLKENRLLSMDKAKIVFAMLPFRKMYYIFGQPIPYALRFDRFVASYDGGSFMVPVLSSASKKVEAYVYDSESLNLVYIVKGLTYSDQEMATSSFSMMSFALGPLGVYLFVGNSEYSGGMSVARPPVIELYGENGKRTRGFLDHGSAVCDTVLSEDGKVVAASLTEGRIRFYNRETGEFLKFLDCPRVFWNGQMAPAPMTDLVVAKDFIAGASPGPHVFVRALGNKDIKAKHLIDPDTGWTDRPVMCGYDNGNKLLVATPMSKLGLRLMETVSGKILRTYEPKIPLRQVLRSGKLVAGISKKYVYVWEIETGKLVNKIECDMSNVSTMAICKGFLYAGIVNGSIVCYELQTGKFVKEFRGHESPVIALGVSPDGRTLVSRSDDAGEIFALKVWDVETGKMLHQYEDEVGPMERDFRAGNYIRFTPDGKYYFFGRGDGSVVYVKLDTVAPIEEPVLPEKPRA